MAAHIISLNGKEYTEDGAYAEAAGEGGARPKRVLYSYFTAGGGAGGPACTTLPAPCLQSCCTLRCRPGLP